MAKTTEMSLIELMVLKQDIYSVVEYIGKKGSFQFQNKESGEKPDSNLDADREIFNQLEKVRENLEVRIENLDLSNYKAPSDTDRDVAARFIKKYNELQQSIIDAKEAGDKINDTYNEVKAFANLQVSYSELENLSFISLKIGKIDPKDFENLRDSVESNATVIPLGEDKSRILVASSKKGRFALETVLKEYDFVPVEIPADFKGVPSDMLESINQQKIDSDARLQLLAKEKENFAETHKQILLDLLGCFAIGIQISDVISNLESTELVYRITGWIPKSETESYMGDLDELTSGRLSFREYEPLEVPSVLSGKEQVPVKLEHKKVVKSFERMIFAYGSPLYGTIDPTPFVAVFFTVLFGIMFGDLGQGLVFVLAGILMAANVIKVGGWNKFAPVFICIGVSSSIMGLLTGEFFSNETLLEPFAEWITGLFGNPHAPILKMMPSSDPNSLKTMFGVFGVAVGVGFIINSIGMIINIINNFILKKYSEALFGKNGIAGLLFFWYVVGLVISIVVFHHKIAVYDWIILGVTLFFSAFAAPFENLIDGKRPVLENGFGTYLISSIVEVIEVISGFLSNTVSFVRVGAFALSHAVLDYVVYILTAMVGGEKSIFGILILIIGNVIIIVLEGMIVAIQVIRLQYYEFFSKFFHHTGREFKPFKFEYNK